MLALIGKRSEYGATTQIGRSLSWAGYLARSASAYRVLYRSLLWKKVMSKICTIRFNHPKTQKGIEITGEFSDPEWKTCLSFVEYADDLSRTQLVRKGNTRLVIQWNAQTGFEPPVLPPVSELSEFLHMMRPFILNKESTYYIKVDSIISKNFQYDYIRKILKMKRNLFLGRAQKNLYQLSTEAIVLSSEEMLKKWLNAYEYHRDESKREELQRLHSDGFPLEIIKFFWIDILLDKAVAIFWLQALIRKMSACEKL
jgi:hypothetical protein